MSTYCPGMLRESGFGRRTTYNKRGRKDLDALRGLIVCGIDAGKVNELVNILLF